MAASQGRARIAALCAADMLCMAASWTVAVCGYWALGRVLAFFGANTLAGSYSPAIYLAFWPVPLVFAAVNALFDTYQGSMLAPGAQLQNVEEMRRLFGSSALTHIALVAVIALAYQTTEGISRIVIVSSGAMAGIACQSFRNWARCALAAFNAGKIDVFLAADGAAADAIAKSLENDAYGGFRVMERFNTGRVREIVPRARALGVKTLVASMDERLFKACAEEFAAQFAHIEYISSTSGTGFSHAKAVSVGSFAAIELENCSRIKAKRLQKRIIDAILAVTAFAIFAPLVAAVAAGVKIFGGRGGVLYSQTRLGRNGKPFRIWKFRTMFRDADERLARLLASDPESAREWDETRKLRRDPRVTAFGRFLRRTSLDELPQLFNVLAGQMSIIGPRPIVSDETRHYGDKYAAVSSVRPGITGLWQVSGRSDTDYDERVKLDLEYVMNWSPWMDFWILVRTIYAVALMRGAR